MVVKKTVTKSSAKKAPAKKPVIKEVAETKKPTVIVETKKTERCDCGENCNCGCSCNCSLKLFILVLVVLNLILSCICCTRLCSKSGTPISSGRSAWDLEALKVWWEENLEKLKNDLYGSEAYKEAQKQSIEAYMQQLWIE